MPRTRYGMVEFVVGLPSKQEIKRCRCLQANKNQMLEILFGTAVGYFGRWIASSITNLNVLC